MPNLLTIILLVGGAGAAGFLLSFLGLKNKKLIDIEKTEKNAKELVDKSKMEADRIKSETISLVQKEKNNNAQVLKNRETRIQKLEEALKLKQSSLDKKSNRLKEVKLELASMEEEIQTKKDSLNRKGKEALEVLSQKTGESVEKIKEAMLSKQEKELELQNGEKLMKMEDILKETAEKKAKKIIVTTIQRLCSPTSVERRAVNIVVPKDRIKGKIVGPEGRNIQELEKLLDVDIIFNDLPNTISISAFNLVLRRIAQVAVEKLINYRKDITPEVVRQIVKEAEKETDEELYLIGKKALARMKMEEKDKKFVRTVGRLQYRTSYGQNIMKHSMEVGWVAAMLGSEAGLDEETCKVAGFLHDVGKAIDQDPNVKDAHDYITKDIMEEHGFSFEEVHAAWTHHDAIPQETPEALIIKAADAVSASRPGARQESFDKYLERMQILKETAESFEGVKKAFAISAGREVRVIVKPEEINDGSMQPLAQKMAQKIEEELVYPGQIKVNVIRRTTTTEIAK